jgi:hypothetical protein
MFYLEMDLCFLQYHNPLTKDIMIDNTIQDISKIFQIVKSQIIISPQGSLSQDGSELHDILVEKLEFMITNNMITRISKTVAPTVTDF